MKFLKWFSLVLIILFIGACTVNNTLASKSGEQSPTTSLFKDGKFHNLEAMRPNGFGKFMEVLVRYVSETKVDPMPKDALPMKMLNTQALKSLSDKTIHAIKLGHSSILLKVYGEFWLLDPVFAERASPFSFMGPKRFHKTPITIEQLPHISKVLISHNHYDHLDKQSVKALSDKTDEFFVPLGVGNDLKKWGVSEEKIQEFDWWQEQKTQSGFVAFTPTKHFSGRAISDRNKTLWGSWVISAENERLYFSGDSGYFDGFKEIGERYGPFDITFIETGAYDKDWPDVHMSPEQSVQAHIDVKGKLMVPIHNGTFDLAFHAWYEPLERVSIAADKQWVQLHTPIVGDVSSFDQPIKSSPWWQSFMPEKNSINNKAIANL